MNGIKELDDTKIKIILQVRPNGIKYKLPLKFKFMQPVMDMEHVQLASSKTELARWRALKLKEEGKLIDERRPHIVEDERNSKRAERWRNQVIREIAQKVAQIQNAGLGEFKIRDLNDEINKLLKEKDAWENRIVELGGPDYKKIGPKILDKEGKEALFLI